LSDAQATGALAGRRVLVVGASSGIGREVGLQAAAAGARVVLAARRLDRLQEAAAEAGDAEVSAVACDVTVPADCEAVVEESLRRLGGLDDLVYATAVDTLVPIGAADPEVWQRTLATNVVGAALVVRAAIAHLEASAGRAVLISATSTGRPLPAMGVYATSKAALEELVRAWRSEHRGVGFTSVRIGMTLGTEVSAAWDPEVLARFSQQWAAEGYLLDNGPGMMSTPQAAAAVLVALTAPVCLRDLTVTAAP
jgi:NAD(P)-dependent dehydrogenase (short-subunit alcohol dehydrogenase family)